MFPKALNPQNTNALRSRCEYRTASGRQCRTPLALGHTTGYCGMDDKQLTMIELVRCLTYVFA